MVALAPFGATDGALLRAMVGQASRGPSEAQLAAAPSGLVAYCATPRLLEQVYPWGARRHLRPRMVRGLVRQLLAAGQLATDGDPADPADWAWLWAVGAASGPGTPPPVADLDRLTPPLGAVHWGDAAETDPAPAPPAPGPTPREPAPSLDRGGMTLTECSAVLGVSRERVRQIEDAALAKLARTYEGKRLLELLTGNPLNRPFAPRPAAPADADPEPPETPVTDYTPTARTARADAEELAAGRVRHKRGEALALALAYLTTPRTLGELGAHLGYTGEGSFSASRAVLKRTKAVRVEGNRWVLPEHLPQGMAPVDYDHGAVARARGESTRQAILDALAAGATSVEALKGTLALGPSMLHRALGNLIADGVVERQGHARYALTKAQAPKAKPPLRLAPAAPPVAQPAEPRRNASVTPAPADRLAAARAAVAALSPEELDALLASLVPVVEARRALAAALAGLRGAA